MTENHVKFTLIAACLSLALIGCSSDESESKAPAEKSTEVTKQQESTPTSAKPSEHDEHAGHDHSQHAYSGPTFEEVEVKDQCEQPTVIEFFAYQCPHCYKLEPEVKKFKDSLEGKVTFKTIPTHLGREQFGVFLLIHDVAERLGVLDQVKPKLFAMLHEQAKPFNSEDDVVQIFVDAGIEKEKAQAAMRDNEKVSQSINSNFQLMQKYKILSVPTVLVNYQYVTDVTKSGGYEGVFKTVNELLEKPADCLTQS